MCVNSPFSNDKPPILRLSTSNMDAILQESFQNMESSINALVDSMTTYNPSTAAVHSLQAANEQFSASLATRTSPFTTPCSYFFSPAS
jgi:hypothetical protein